MKNIKHRIRKKPTPEQVKYNNQLVKQIYKPITFRIRRECEQTLNDAVAASGLSKSSYIKQALNKQLIQDGFTKIR